MGERVLFYGALEEYGTHRYYFYDDMVGSNSYSHLNQNPLLLYDDAHLHDAPMICI